MCMCERWILKEKEKELTFIIVSFFNDTIYFLRTLICVRVPSDNQRFLFLESKTAKCIPCLFVSYRTQRYIVCICQSVVLSLSHRVSDLR